MRRARVILGVVVAVLAGAAQAAELPAEIRSASALRLTVNATYAPMEYRDPATNDLKGLDIELATEMARRLGLKIVWSEVPFAELIPSLATKRADFIISGISDRASRRETADFIDYLTTGPQFFTLAGGPVAAPGDLCGRTVGTVRSTSFPAEIEAWSRRNCEGAGKAAIRYAPGENSIDVRNQLKQGRIEAAVQGSETLPYAQGQEPGRYRVLGEPFALGYQGIMVRKGEAALREVLTATLAAMMADGSYKAVLDRYGLGANALEAPKLNASPQ